MSLYDWFSVQKTTMHADSSVLMSPCSECWALVGVDDAKLHQRWHKQLAGQGEE
jgi:hypothetical protein